MRKKGHFLKLRTVVSLKQMKANILLKVFHHLGQPNLLLPLYPRIQLQWVNRGLNLLQMDVSLFYSIIPFSTGNILVILHGKAHTLPLGSLPYCATSPHLNQSIYYSFPFVSTASVPTTFIKSLLLFQGQLRTPTSSAKQTIAKA